MSPQAILHDRDLWRECPNRHPTRRRWDPTAGAMVEERVLHDLAPSQRAVSCWSCRSRRRRQHRSVRQRPRLPPNPGVCVLCGEPLTGRKQSWCSALCMDLWSAGPRWVTAHLIDLHGHECWECGARWEPPVPPENLLEVRTPWGREECQPRLGPPAPIPIALELDHRRPLWSLSESERSEPRWWLPFNLQLLCRPCHAAKTAREAAERAALRRAGG